MSDLKNKIVLIAGASSGIGEGTAHHFASLGSKLALVGRKAAALEDVKAKCIEKGSPEVFLLVKDLESEESCRKSVTETVEHFGSE